MENKRRIPDGVAVTAGLLLLLLCGLAAIFAGGGEYDEVERRYLASFPEMKGEYSFHLCESADGVQL